MCSIRKLIYLSFYFLNINFSFCLNLYTTRLKEIENNFISNNIELNIQNLTNEIKEKTEKEKNTDKDIEFINGGNIIITIYNNVTNNKKKTDFKYIYDSLKKVKFDFSKNDTEYCCSNQFLILRSLLFNALKEKIIMISNFDPYIKAFTDLKTNKIIGDYTYRNAVAYILKSIFNKVTYDDIKKPNDVKNPNVLNVYLKKICPIYDPEFDYYPDFASFLEDVFTYIVDKETKSCNEINEGNRNKIVTILKNFPFGQRKDYTNYVNFLFYLLSKDLNVVYDQKNGSFLLKSLDSFNGIDGIYNKEIKNNENLE